MSRRIILGLTGSVASVLHIKLVEQLQIFGVVDVILTERSKHFIEINSQFQQLVEFKGGKIYTDVDEWSWNNDGILISHKWKKNDEVLHINLRNNTDALVMAPCSANTLAKLANGITDNLLTSVARAWDFNRPIIIALAMNSQMYNHPITEEHISKLMKWNYTIVSPQSKMLACKTIGIGGMADINKISDILYEKLQWYFPLASYFNEEEILKSNCSGIPVGKHPGAFLTKRKHHIHTGVDLYTTDGQPVYAVEDGVVIAHEQFTGISQSTPWWNDTECLLVEGASGVVCYGEIIAESFSIGNAIKRGNYIGRVKRVLKDGKERSDIAGHSTSMLHLELYKHGITRAFEEVGENKSNWDDLINPTQYLIHSIGAPENTLL